VTEPPPLGFSSWEEWYLRHDIPEGEWDDATSLVDPEGIGARIFFQRVPEPKTVKNRLHLDVRVGGNPRTPVELRWPRVTAAVERLTASGATVVRQDDWLGSPHHVVMADPEGNEFCLA
jgi:glyoxalase superfamily protein